MATSNFHSVNTSSIYVINYGDDDYAWQECQDLIGSNILELDKEFEPTTSLDSYQELRSFPASSIGFWRETLDFLNISFDIDANLFIRSGYYTAANLDYEMVYYVNGEQYDSISDIIDVLTNYPEDFDISKGLATIHSDNLYNKLTTLESDLISKIDKVLSKVSEPYNVVAHFSNGETMYEKAP